MKIGILREGKVPRDYRVPFSPVQCADIQKANPDIQFVVQPSSIRCFKDEEYRTAGIEVKEDIQDCAFLFGVKEVPMKDLLEGKTYFFFSHTKKKQAHNRELMRAMIRKKIHLVDYECLVHEDGHRMIGFGYWAGVVGAHNGLLTYGKKFGLYHLTPAHLQNDFSEIKKEYETIKWPHLKIAVTGSGRVASGILDVMKYNDFTEVDPDAFLSKKFHYPVFVDLRGKDLYARKDDSTYDRNDFHKNAEAYTCLFKPYAFAADILMNGIYWDQRIPPLFRKEDIQDERYRMDVIADITCDEEGSVPVNYGATTIQDPVYGVLKEDFSKTGPFQNTRETVDIMAVDNLPSELPKDASRYFGATLEKLILPELFKSDSEILNKATICREGKLGAYFGYLEDYAFGEQE